MTEPTIKISSLIADLFRKLDPGTRRSVLARLFTLDFETTEASTISAPKKKTAKHAPAPRRPYKGRGGAAPTSRLRILTLLGEGPAKASELASRCGMTRHGVSVMLTGLFRAKMVEPRGSSRWARTDAGALYLAEWTEAPAPKGVESAAE